MPFGIQWLTDAPNIIDIFILYVDFANDSLQSLFRSTKVGTPAVASIKESNEFDYQTKSWIGEEGLHYRIPLIPLPSEQHTRYKSRNIKVLMDNCRSMCVSNNLPCTQTEKEFWMSYRFRKYQMYFSIALCVTPPLYLLSKLAQPRLPTFLRGRSLPITTGLALSEIIYESLYPGHSYLKTALSARTPMGDAARAEWARLQSIFIPYHIYLSYEYSSIFGFSNEGLLFGGNTKFLSN